MIRRIIPKGTDLGNYSQEQINLMMSHINSYTRPSLGDKSPYDLFAFLRSLILAFLIFILYMVYFPPKTNLFIRCTIAWIIGPDIKTVIIVQIPKLPPNKTPITTIATSNIIPTILTGHPFFSTRENVTAS